MICFEGLRVVSGKRRSYSARAMDAGVFQMKKDQKNKQSTSARKAWRKPVLVVHGDLLTLTRAKDPGGTDSGLGTPTS